MNKSYIKSLLIILILLLSFGLFACKEKGNSNSNNNNQEEYDLSDLSVRDYTAKNGIVTAANPYAANVGIEILKKGGNAFDAAVAVAFAIGVCEMDASGIGGGGLIRCIHLHPDGDHRWRLTVVRGYPSRQLPEA